VAAVVAARALRMRLAVAVAAVLLDVLASGVGLRFRARQLRVLRVGLHALLGYPVTRPPAAKWELSGVR